MKNKIKLKKHLTKIFFISVLLLILFLVLNKYEYHTYTTNFNTKIDSIITELQRNYPELTEYEIIRILNSTNEESTGILEKYGIDLTKDSIILKNDSSFHKFLIINLSFLIITIIILIYMFLRYDRRKEKDISDITKCIEEINNKNYELNIDSMSEDELSILKNEIYKTTIMLKELALNSNLDKINLKKSLEDISHQLKTPLTSILVMLDNLIDDPEMNINTRNEFIRDIKRNVVNINFLVQALLKLSKFDSNTVHFTKKENDLRKIINEAVQNVSTLCDLKNINIEIVSSGDVKIMCDAKWQIEAITNILKNCVDYSKENQKIIVKYEDYNAYKLVSIKDFGEGISKKDLQHIFERFYKGSNATSDSVGIGLALAKTIINEDNGTISVSSNENGTTFTIKYFRL